MNLGLQGSCKTKRATEENNQLQLLHTHEYIHMGGVGGKVREGVKERRRGKAKGKRKENFKKADYV